CPYTTVFRSVRFADEDFSVPGIGEPMAVRDAHRAAARDVAGNRAVPRHQRGPEERHQPLAARLGGRRPVALIRARLFHACVAPTRRSEDAAVEPTEDLLRPDAVERDEDDVLGAAAGWRGRLDQSKHWNAKENAAADADVGQNDH